MDPIIIAELEHWRDELLERLARRSSQFVKRRRYYDTEHMKVTAPSTASDKYKRLAELGVTNMCGLVVDTVTTRLVPKGVRIGGEDDLDVWQQVWQRNSLDGDIPVAIEEALKVGYGPVMVWKDGAGAVTVTVEDPDETIVAYAPGSRRDRVAALKCFIDGDFFDVTVQTAEWVCRWRQNSKVSSSGWELQDGYPAPNPFGKVTIVELRSKPNAKGIPKPEISEAVIRLQDRLNKTMFDAVTGAEDGAFPQRVTIGIEVETDEDGNPVNPLTMGPNRVVALKSEDSENPGSGKVDQFPAYDIAGLLKLADTTIQQLASISVTPVFYLMAGMNNVGSDTIRAAERGHVDKCRGHQTVFGEALEEIIRLGMIGMDLPEVSDIEIDWTPLETRSPTELADAVIKYHSAGYPFVAIVRLTGATQSEVERTLREKLEQDAAQRSPADLATLANAYGALVRAAATAETAAAVTGLDVASTGAAPITLRPTESQAAALEPA